MPISARRGWSFYEAFVSASSDLRAAPGSMQALSGLLDPTLSAASVDAAVGAVLKNLSPEQLTTLVSDLAEASLEMSYRHLRNSSV